jgi:Replication initiation factor
VPASVLESLPSPSLRALLTTVALYAQNVSRCDVTLDDWMKVVTPAQLDALTTSGDSYELEKGQLVTRAEQSQLIRSKGPRGGDTWYLGGTGGLARLRVYDKFRESGGEVDAIRWELQLRGDRAKDAVVALAMEALNVDDLDAVMGEWAAAQLVRFVDFRDRSVDSNISRCPRLPWWVCLVLNASKARSVVVKPPLTVERMHDYAQKALPSFLATLADSAGIVCGVPPELWLLAMVDEGRRNRSARHEMVLRSAGVGRR